MRIQNFVKNHLSGFQKHRKTLDRYQPADRSKDNRSQRDTQFGLVIASVMSDAKARHVDAVANDMNPLFWETNRCVKIVAQRFRNRKNPIGDVPKQSLYIAMH